MKLYYYDHCPYCTRVRLALALLSLEAEGVVLENDDAVIPTELIGKKMVPILVTDDGQAMGESLDIVQYLESISAYSLSHYVREEVQQWVVDINQLANLLYMPRVVQLGLGEFRTSEALHYFIQNKTDYIGDFQKHIDNTSEYLKQWDQALAGLNHLIKADYALNGECVGLEDILVFPILRNLTCVAGIQLSTQVKAYLSTMSAESDIPLWFDQAI